VIRQLPESRRGTTVQTLLLLSAHSSSGDTKLEVTLRRFDMQRKFTSLVLLGATILSSAGGALATPSNGFTSTPLAKGQIGAFEISNFFVSDKGKLWLSFQKTIGKSDTYVLSNVWQPGGSTGWHTHPAATLVIVTAGAITQYEADDPN